MIELSEREKRLVRVLQEGLSVGPEPFRAAGEAARLRQKEVLAKIQEWKERGLIRRFGAILRHQQAGLAANAMVVWQVDSDRVDEVGEVMAGFKEVSHCYERPTFDDWPYNLYTMVHGKTRAECEAVAGKISKRTGIETYKLLFTTNEYKKESPRYFVENG